MKTITILDTSVATKNVGDSIIMDSVNRELKELFKKDMIFYSITQGKVDKASYDLFKLSNYSFVGGTNLLSSNMNKYNQWKINLIDSIYCKNMILMGVGWWQYQQKPNFYTRYLLKSVLNKNILHSVRDSYTETLLKDIGIKNVINTGCPTMWQLSEDHCKKIPTMKAKNVVFTLTDYNRDMINDQKLINVLIENYEKVYYWPQGSEDFKYIKLFKNINDIQLLGGNLDSYDELLDNKDISLDFVGTRLHAGIRSLQKLRRTLIIGIDNRAEEKSKDFNLNVLSRINIDKLNEIIKNDIITDIHLKNENIIKWRNQFK